MGNGSGLAAQWGLNQPSSGEPSEQADQLKSDLKPILKRIEAAFKDTITVASKTDHEALAAKRDQAYSDYQDLLKKIDPQDESKAESDIRKFLGAMESLASEAEGLRATSMAAKAQWDAMAGEHAQAENEIGEIDAWGMAKAAALLADLAKIEDALGERDWEGATTALEALMQATSPVYEELKLQKEAMARYERERPPLDKASGEARGYSEPTEEIKGLFGEIGASLGETDTKASEKDYIAACDVLPAVQSAIEKAKEAIALHQQQKRDYEEGLARVTPRLELIPSGYPDLEKLEGGNLKTYPKEMTDLAAAADYGGALDKLRLLEAQLDTYEQLVADAKQEEEEYNTRHQAVVSRFESIPSGFKSLEPDEANLQTFRDEMEVEATAKKFEQALSLMDRLESGLTGYETKVADLNALKTEYEAGAKEQEPRLAAVPSGYPQLESVEQNKLGPLKTDMEAAAAGGEYRTALEELALLSSQLDTYEQLLADVKQEEAAFKARWQEVQPRFDEAMAARENEEVKTLQANMTTNKTTMEGAETEKNFEQALTSLDLIVAQLDAFDDWKAKLEAKKAEYEGRSQALDPRVAKAKEEAGTQLLKEQQGIISNLDTEMRAAADKEDYEEALVTADMLEAELAGYEKLVEQYEAKKQEYEDRLAAMQADLEEAAQETKNTGLLMVQGKIVTHRDAMTAAAETGDYETALREADWLEPSLAGYKDLLADLAAEKAEYETRMAALGPRLEKISAPIEVARLKKNQENILGGCGEIEDQAAAENYDEALRLLDQVEALVTMQEGDLEIHLAKKQEYEDRLAGEQERIAAASRNTNNHEAKSIQVNMDRNKGEMTKAADAGDYPTALTKLDLLVAQLDAFDDWMAKLSAKKQEYETRRDALQGDLAKAEQPVKTEIFNTEQTVIAELRGDMATAEAAEDYDKALMTVARLETELAGYLKMLEQHNAKKAEYETRKQAVDQRMAEIPSGFAILAATEDKLVNFRDAMQTAADGDDYDKALGLIDRLEAGLAGYEARLRETTENKSAFDAGWKAMEPRLAKLPSGFPHLEKLETGKIVFLRGGVLDAQTAGDFSAALRELAILEAQMDTYEQLVADAEAEEVEYKARHKSVSERMTGIPSGFAEAKAIEADLQAFHAKMETAAQARRFEEALSLIDRLEAGLTGWESNVETLAREAQVG